LCPVGAMVSKEFLFKSRVWWLTHTESICPLCSRGCNIEIDSRDNRILRVRPRLNLEVNSQWMCDDGRFGWGFVHREDRLISPLKREGEELAPIKWAQAINLVKERLSFIISNFGREAVAAIASPYLSNEDNYLLRMLLHSVIRSPHMAVYQAPQVEERMVFPFDFTIEADRSPNLAGVQDVATVNGKKPISHRQLLQKVASGEVRALYILGGAPIISLPVDEREMLRKADFLVVHDYAPSELTEWAEVVFPNLTFAEREGTFTNFQGRVQRLKPALLPPGEAKADREILQEVCQAMGGEMSYHSAEKVFEEIAGAVRSYKGLCYKDLGNQGKVKG
ncbi:MAG: molybdopterin-dependent oxidoreductase, partial [Acidobacteriota bacterium]